MANITYIPPRNNKAKNIKIEDSDNNFQSNDVEGALKELAENSSGMSLIAKNLLITILQNGIYTSDQSSNIVLLSNALTSSGSEGELTKYTITNALTNCTNSNTSVVIIENINYIATITANNGYILDSVTVTMGGVDITSSVYSNGNINISSVTGNVVITAKAISNSSGGTGLVTDGLVDYFDFRTVTYNNTGTGGSTLITPTQGKGQLYAWSNNVVTEQGQYGVKISRGLMYNNAGGTTQTECGSTFTWMFNSYVTNSSPFFSKDYAQLSTLYKLSYKPKYNTISSQSQVSQKELGTRTVSGYDTVVLTVDNKVAKLYFGGQLIDTVDGTTISDFVSWFSKLTCEILGGSSQGYLSQLVIYNKALSEVEIVDNVAYLDTLEVK